MPKPGTRRRPLRELSACSLALLVALMLGACTQPPPKPIPSGPSAAEPVFASDAEALAAAEAAYGLYQDMWNLIAIEGGADSDRIRPFVHPDNQEETIRGLTKFSERGVHSDGKIVISDVRLQSYKDVAEHVAVVAVYACLDLRSSRVINADGVDVTPPERLEQVPGQIRFISSDPLDPQNLVFGGDSAWNGDNFCL